MYFSAILYLLAHTYTLAEIAAFVFVGEHMRLRFVPCFCLPQANANAAWKMKTNKKRNKDINGEKSINEHWQKQQQQQISRNGRGDGNGPKCPFQYAYYLVHKSSFSIRAAVEMQLRKCDGESQESTYIGVLNHLN